MNSPAMHSFLFVPGDRPERFAKAQAAGAHAVILDLEDAVAPQAKDAAREACMGWLASGRQALLRINGADTRWHADDLALLRLKGLRGVMLPKAEDPVAVAAIAALLPHEALLVPLLETAEGIWNAREIARVPGVHRLAFGSVDFQLDAGIEGDDDALLYARSRLVLASRLGRLASPLDGVTLAIGDAAALAADVARARRLGFGGKLCIHPSQVGAVNEGFAPAAHELHWAAEVVAAAMKQNGAFLLRGKMVDRPVIERAHRLLAMVPQPVISPSTA
jgi:citrate lyase subunit beta/citryl-CoA lyase